MKNKAYFDALDDAIYNAAIGGISEEKTKITVSDKNGKVVSEENIISEKPILPSISVLKGMLESKIGGDIDYC